MKKPLILGGILLLFCFTAFAMTAIDGRIETVDHTAKIMVVKAKDSMEHTFLFAGGIALRVGEKADVAAEESLHGLKEGSDLVGHCATTKPGTTGPEIIHRLASLRPMASCEGDATA